MIIDGRGCLVSDVKLDVETVTLVNLLGIYGNFEKDSDGDGIPDGVFIYYWMGSGSLSQSIDYPVVGSKSVHISCSSGKYGLYIKALMSLTAGEHAYGRCYARLLGEARLYFEWYKKTDWSWADEDIERLDTSDWKWLLFDIKSEAPPVSFGDSEYHSELRFLVTEGGQAYVDAFCIYNLTRMGQLPQPLKDYYQASGYARWDDLPADELAWLLPYVDGVATIGWDWVHGALTPILEIRHGGVL